MSVLRRKFNFHEMQIRLHSPFYIRENSRSLLGTQVIPLFLHFFLQVSIGSVFGRCCPCLPPPIWLWSGTTCSGRRMESGTLGRVSERSHFRGDFNATCRPRVAAFAEPGPSHRDLPLSVTFSCLVWDAKKWCRKEHIVPLECEAGAWTARSPSRLAGAHSRRH